MGDNSSQRLKTQVYQIETVSNFSPLELSTDLKRISQTSSTNVLNVYFLSSVLCFITHGLKSVKTWDFFSLYLQYVFYSNWSSSFSHHSLCSN